MKSAIGISAALTCLSACAIAIQQESVFLPQQDNRRGLGAELTINNEDTLPDNFEIIHERLETTFGSVAATHVKTGSDRLIVACMGNAGERLTSGVPYLEGFTPFGDVLMFDYPGYGDSEGSPSLQNFENTNDAIANKVTSAEYGELIIWGHSLGGFVCGELAKILGDQADAMIFETTASDVDAVTDAWMPWYAKLFVRVQIEEGLRAYDNVQAMANFNGAIAVLGATEDRQLSVKLSRKLAEGLEASGKTVTYYEFKGANHSSVSDHPEYKANMSAFLETNLVR